MAANNFMADEWIFMGSTLEVEHGVECSALPAGRLTESRSAPHLSSPDPKECHFCRVVLSNAANVQPLRQNWRMQMMPCQNRIALFLAVLSLGMGFAGPVAAADSSGSVEISEFLADNQHGLKDEDGERSGWIEIYNWGTSTLHLAGW